MRLACSVLSDSQSYCILVLEVVNLSKKNPSFMDKVRDSISLPNDYPSVEHAVAETRPQAKMRHAQLVGQKYASKVNGRSDYLVVGFADQFNLLLQTR